MPQNHPLSAAAGDRTVFIQAAGTGAGGDAAAAGGDVTMVTMTRWRPRPTQTTKTIAVHRRLLLRQRPRRQLRPRDTETPVGDARVSARDGAGARVDDSNRCTRRWCRTARRRPSRTFFPRQKRPSRTTRKPRWLKTVCQPQR